MDGSLTAWRTLAANASGGTSSEPIYRLIEGAIADLNLTGSVLDYGAGTGSLTNRLIATKRFSQVHAVDIMPPPESKTESIVWHRQDLNDHLSGELDSSFDLVVAAETIEHLENPRFVMRQLYKVCRSGGFVFVTTPNNETFRSFLALAFRGHYVAFGGSSYPAHITALLRLDLIRMASEAGFHNPAFRYTNNGCLPFLTHMTWQQISLNLLKGLRFSDNLLLVCQKPD